MDTRDAKKPPYDRRKEDPWHVEIKAYVDARHEENAERFDRIEGRVGVLEAQGKHMQEELSVNTALTAAVKRDTASLVAATHLARAVRAGIAGMGKMALFISPVVAALSAVASAFIAYWIAKK